MQSFWVDKIAHSFSKHISRAEVESVDWSFLDKVLEDNDRMVLHPHLVTEWPDCFLEYLLKEPETVWPSCVHMLFSVILRHNTAANSSAGIDTLLQVWTKYGTDVFPVKYTADLDQYMDTGDPLRHIRVIQCVPQVLNVVSPLQRLHLLNTAKLLTHTNQGGTPSAALVYWHDPEHTSLTNAQKLDAQFTWSGLVDDYQMPLAYRVAFAKDNPNPLLWYNYTFDSLLQHAELNRRNICTLSSWNDERDKEDFRSICENLPWPQNQEWLPEHTGLLLRCVHFQHAVLGLKIPDWLTHPLAKHLYHIIEATLPVASLLTDSPDKINNLLPVVHNVVLTHLQQDYHDVLELPSL